MKRPVFPTTHIAAVLLLGFLVFVAAVMLPLSSTSAEPTAEVAIPSQSEPTGLPNFDIRDEPGTETLVGLRNAAGRDRSFVDAVRQRFASGEEKIRTKVPGVVLEYDRKLGQPEVIAPDVWQKSADMLTPASSGSRSARLRNFIDDNVELFGSTAPLGDGLKEQADYTNPDGNLSFVHLQQEVNGVPVFAGEVKAAFDSEGRMVRVVNNIAPGLDGAPVSKEFGDSRKAVVEAGRHIGRKIARNELALDNGRSTPLKAVFGEGDWATTAEKVYFPTEPGVVVPAWRVLIWGPVDSYYVIVDADGTMLWRKNITEHQSQPATFNVYRNANAFMDVADSPAPLSPGPSNNNGAQGSIIARENVTLVGNEDTNAFNNNGWITDGQNITDGYPAVVVKRIRRFVTN